MSYRGSILRRTWRGALAVVLCCGCQASGVWIKGQVPPPSQPADALTAMPLSAASEGTAETPVPTPHRIKGSEEANRKPELLPPPKAADADRDEKKPPRSFELPPGLPGARVPPLRPPQFKKGTPLAERIKAIQQTYPKLPLLPPSEDEVRGKTPVPLAELQHIATANSPVLRRARADVDAAEGEVIQAGLYPNPTVGYQADQVQPGSNGGQQGVYLNQLLKRPGKLSLAASVAAFDHLNAQVAARRAVVDVMTQVRTAYFGLVVANKGVEVNRALVTLADEVYGLQLKQLAGGEASGYEPLQLYAQAVQARNSLAQARANSRAAWKQLAAAIGKPGAAPLPVTGRADAPPPAYDSNTLQTMLMNHTDMLTAHNTFLQAQVNLKLQELIPRPDLQTNSVVQFDSSTNRGQFNLQLGVALPVFDKNQGNIFKARAQIGRAAENVNAVRNDLTGRLAEAFGRYEANVVMAENFRNGVIPNLTRAYRAIIRRYQVEPEKVGFNDIVVAQQNLAQALQGYLTALDSQWRAVVDVANLAQLDDLYCRPPNQEEGKPGTAR